MPRPYKITVTVLCEADGEEVQTVLCRETSASEADHVLKAFVINRHVKDATYAAMDELATAAGYKTKTK